MNRTKLAATAIGCLMFSTAAQAAVEAGDAGGAAIIPEDAGWAGLMVVIVLGLFLAAAVIGPIVRILMPEELPPVHSHDEPPGASDHHGASGTHGAGHGGHHH